MKSPLSHAQMQELQTKLQQQDIQPPPAYSIRDAVDKRLEHSKPKK